MITSSVFAARRRQFIDTLHNEIIVVCGYDAMQLSADMAAPFRQQSVFHWLVGIDEPGWKYIVVDGNEYLVQPERSETQLIFEGGVTQESATDISGVELVASWDEAQKLLTKAATTHNTVHTLGDDVYADSYDFHENPSRINATQWLKEQFKEVSDCWPVAKKLMAIKDEAAIEELKKAIAISEKAFEATYKNLQSAGYEYEIEADLTYNFRKQGADGEAYETIVAAGENACTLHYVKNNSQLPGNGLLLIDAGALVDCYAADITRTYAIGTPTDRQVAVHKAVETAHFKIIDLIKPGLNFIDYQQLVDEIMKDALIGLNLLKSHDDEKTYRTYFPHAISHGLGLDVHESLGGYKEFRPGMVLTVEPGIYITEEGIGVRIEDDILVTEDGHLNLSSGLPTSL